MRSILFNRGLFLRIACSFLGVATTATAQTINTYEINFTGAPPTIDGVVSPDEWHDAFSAAGSWRLLRETNRVDNQNSRWQAMWDEDALYILFQSDYANWSSGPSQSTINFNDDNLICYFDPNTDGEPNNTPFPDGYQIAFNQYVGFSAIDGDALSNTGAFYEAHEDTPFGNQGAWDGPDDLLMRQNMGTIGGVTEIKLPWLDFDADDPALQNNAKVNGLYHAFAPADGDTWYFKISRITSDHNNFLPDWNPTDSQSFAVRPHGEITFVRHTVPEQATWAMLTTGVIVGGLLVRRVAPVHGMSTTSSPSQ